MAVSLTGQAVAVALLILLPLLYNDRLPDVRPLSILVLPPAPLPPPPEIVPAAKASQSTLPGPSSRRIFTMPTNALVHDGPVVVSLQAPAFDDAAVGVPASIGLPSVTSLIAVAPTLEVKPVEKPPLRVISEMQAAKLVKRVVPAYPLPAKLTHVSGTVHLIGVIAKDGTIQRLELVSGHPLLAKAALDAVRQWVYRPTLLNGEAVEVIAPIDVIFTLQ